MNIGPYSLGQSLGTGTVCETFLATDSAGKSVVVKRLAGSFAGQTAIVDRFLGAVELSAKITSPRFLTKVLMHNRSDALVHLVREHIEGKSLIQIEGEGGLRDLDAKKLSLDLCESLRALHRQGIIHGGIHPGNVYVQSDGRLKLTDYGISRASLLGNVDSDYPLLALRYLPPEVIKGRPAGLSADLYAAWLVAYFLAERRHLIDGNTASQIRDRIQKGPSTPTPIPGRALHLDPASRFANPDELRTALVAWFAEREAGPAPPPPPPPAAVAPPPPPPAPPPTPVAPPERVERPPAPRGSLSAMIDLKTGQDLLPLNGQPWRLQRTGTAQEWPIVFKNRGPGELHLRVRTAGDGVRIAPRDQLKIPPNASRYVIVTLDAHGGDFARLDVEVVDGKPSERVRIRVYRPQ